MAAKNKNIFEKAKKKGVSKKAEKHEVVKLPKLEKSLSKMAEINKKIAELEVKKSQLYSDISNVSKEEMIKLYNSKKSFPGTLKIISGEMGFQFITSDRYITIDEERYEELIDIYGEDIVKENVKFSFNTKILMKHYKHISELLMKSKKISESDKEELLESETSYSIKKGTFKNLFSFVDDDVEGIIEDIRPIFSIKSIKKEE